MATRVLIVADVPNWAFAARAEQLRKNAPKDIDIEVIFYGQYPVDAVVFHRYDVVFVLPTNLVGPLRRVWNAAKLEVPLIASHNSGVGRRHWVLLETLLASDYVVVNNYGCWANVRAFVDEKKFCACNISNGVDLDVFRPQTPISERPHTALWSSSTSKITPQTADQLDDPEQGDVKGYKLILEPLQMILGNQAKNGWASNWLLVDPGAGLSYQDMADYYNSGSYLICASVSEGTPNIALEAAACGCVIITTPVGNMPELIQDGRNGVFCKRSTSDFWKGLKFAKEHREELSAAVLKTIQSWDWTIRSQWFYELFRRCAARDYPKPFTYVDTAPAEM